MNNLNNRIENQLKLQLINIDNTPQKLLEAMRYAVLNGGKRIRPQLVYASGQCMGAELEKLDIAAAAVEFIHCYSLVHDDLPAMDDDDLRRGKPSCHKAFGEATAILCGDALQNLGFEILSKPQSLYPASTQIKMINTLALATGAQGMIGGQVLDIQNEGQQCTSSEIENMHSLKTGALIRASVLLGALAADTSEREIRTLEQFANIIGLAFQIKDDILDATSDSKTLGKTAGADFKNNKANALAIDLNQSQQRTEVLLTEAKATLNLLPQNTSQLEKLAEYIIQREN